MSDVALIAEQMPPVKRGRGRPRKHPIKQRFSKGSQAGKKGSVGRPTAYSPEIVEYIIDQMAEGKDLTTICQDPRMPHRVTVGHWLSKYPEFAFQYEIAKNGLADHYFKQMMDIIRDTSNSSLGADNLKVKTLQWACSRMSRNYAEKREISNNTSVDITVNSRIDLTRLEPEAVDQLEMLIAAAEGKLIEG